MSIYRGAGGAGDAVADSSSEALLIRELAVEVQADADAAAASATSAAGSASTASTAATNAQTAETNAETAETNAETAEANAETAQAAAEAAQLAAETAQTAAELAETNAETAETNAETAASLAQEWATKLSTPVSGSDYSAKYNANLAAASASAAQTAETNAETAQSAAESARDATLAAYDSFDDRYLGSKSSAPSVDNDGNALTGGALYFDTVSQGMKVYTGSAWVDAYVPGSTYLAKSNNLSDLTNTATARTNLGVAIGTNVQAYDADLATIAGLTPTNNYAIIGNGTSWTSSALPSSGVTSVTGTSPISSSGGATPAISLDNSGVTANTYGSSSAIPVVTVNAKGLITGVTTATVAGGQYFGSAATKAIAYNANTIGENVTVTTGNNGLSAGPITISDTYTVTVQTGAVWVIV